MPNCSASRTLLAEAKPIGFVRLEQGDERLDPAPRNLAQFIFENAATVWAKHNGQWHPRTSFNPKY